MITSRHRQDPCGICLELTQPCPSLPPNQSASPVPDAAREGGLLRTGFPTHWRRREQNPTPEAWEPEQNQTSSPQPVNRLAPACAGLPFWVMCQEWPVIAAAPGSASSVGHQRVWAPPLAVALSVRRADSNY